MGFLVTLSINLIAAVIAVWMHEIPKYYLTIYLTRPAFRQDVKIKKAWINCIDPIGLILFTIVGTGWQMPLKVDATKLINKKNGLLAISLSGIFVSLISAIGLTLLRKYWILTVPKSEEMVLLMNLLLQISYFQIVLVMVNLLPVPPFDITKLIYAFSSDLYFKIIQNGRMIQSLFVLFLVFGGLKMLSGFLFSSLYYLFW